MVSPRPIKINRGCTNKLMCGSLNLNEKKHDENNYIKPCPKGTTLITGDSILCGVRESKLKKAKVRSFLGDRVEDMYHYLTPLIKKKPTNTILHIGSNDAPYKSSG